MTIEQLKSKIQVGDYGVAAKMLNTSVDNVRKRFQREKEDVLTALQTIIENRNQLIETFQSKKEQV